MNTIESSIVSKITTEIETAVGDERSKLIDDLWTFVTIAEKRLALEAKGTMATVKDEAKTVASAVEKAAGTLLHEAEAKL